MKYLITFVLFFVTTALTIACSCMSPKKITIKDVENAHSIFKGVVQSIEQTSDGRYKRVMFKVQEMYKGNETKKEIEIYTRESTGSCGLDIELNEVWYIYSYSGDEMLVTSRCDRNVKFHEPVYRGSDLRRNFQKERYEKALARFEEDLKFIQNYMDSLGIPQ